MQILELHTLTSAQVEDLFLPTYRGQGLVRILLHRIIDLAGSKLFPIDLCLSLKPSHAEANALYQALGLEPREPNVCGTKGKPGVIIETLYA